MDGSGGKYFVSSDPDCNSPLSSDLYPASFEAVSLCGKTASGVDGGERRA
jgi:hypothetical protein